LNEADLSEARARQPAVVDAVEFDQQRDRFNGRGGQSIIISDTHKI
jgi:hypothetical protein